MSESLSSLGSDLSFTISFSISRELLDAAKDAGVSQEELVAIVLGVGVVFTAFPRTLSLAYKVVRGSEKGEDKGADDDGGAVIGRGMVGLGTEHVRSFGRPRSVNVRREVCGVNAPPPRYSRSVNGECECAELL